MQQKLLLEIEKVKLGKSNKNLIQLQTILDELQNNSESKKTAINYARVIIDSWDYSDELGNELIELAELYRRI